MVGTTLPSLARTPRRVILVIEIGSCFQPKASAEPAKAKKTWFGKSHSETI